MLFHHHHPSFLTINLNRWQKFNPKKEILTWWTKDQIKGNRGCFLKSQDFLCPPCWCLIEMGMVRENFCKIKEWTLCKGIWIKDSLWIMDLIGISLENCSKMNMLIFSSVIISSNVLARVKKAHNNFPTSNAQNVNSNITILASEYTDQSSKPKFFVLFVVSANKLSSVQ